MGPLAAVLATALALPTAACTGHRPAESAPASAADPAATTHTAPDAPGAPATRAVSPDYTVKTESRAAQPVLTVHIEASPGDLDARITEAFEAIYPYVAEQGASPAGAPYSCYHEFTADRVVADIGVPTSTELPPSGSLRADQLPAGLTTSVVHQGAYQDLERAHGAIRHWIDRHQKRVRGTPCELYEVGPGQVEDEREYRTRVVYWLEE